MGELGELIMHEIGTNVPKAGTWRGLLFHWGAVLNHYLAWEKKDEKDDDYYDLPHWHNERAQIGFLAAAVWRMGGAALEEYRTGRADNNATEVTETTPGRCDLYFSVENLYCVVESKCEWLTTYSRENAGQIEKKMALAYEQLKKLDKSDRAECEGLALCWGVATRSGSADDEKENLRRFAYGFKGPNRVLGVYYVPSPIRTKVEKRFGDKGETYPGVVLIGETHPLT